MPPDDVLDVDDVDVVPPDELDVDEEEVDEVELELVVPDEELLEPSPQLTSVTRPTPSAVVNAARLRRPTRQLVVGGVLARSVITVSLLTKFPAPPTQRVWRHCERRSEIGFSHFFRNCRILAGRRWREIRLKLRLFHQLFAMIGATALIAALSMAVVFAMNLHNGFNGYLAARDIQELDQFVGVAEQRLAHEGGDAALRQHRVTLGSLLRELAVAEGGSGLGFPVGGPPPRIIEGLSNDQMARPTGARLGFFSPPPQPPPQPPPSPSAPSPMPGAAYLAKAPSPPADFGARLILYDALGHVLAGPPHAENFPLDVGPSRSIRYADHIIATVRMIPRGGSPSGVDARFLMSQYEGAGVLMVLLLLLGAIPAWGIARAATRRLDAMYAATDAIAKGDLNTRIGAVGSDEIADMGRNINLMAESLQRLDTARRRWLAEVSHELRTPLSAIRGELDALEDGIRPLNFAAIASLNDDAHRLSALVEDLHTLSIADLSALPCHHQRFDAVLLCQQIVERFAPQGLRDGIVLHFKPEGAEEISVWWDMGRIDQLLTNVITNSLR